MKYLLPLMMFISVMCTAQPGIHGLRKGIAGYERIEGPAFAVEVGVLGGLERVDIAKRGGRDNNIVRSGKAWMAEVDFYHGGKKFPLAFNHGLRVGNDAFTNGFFSYVIGLQYSSMLPGNLGLRFSGAAGPMLSNLKPNLIAEISTDVLINQRISAGVKYMLPFWAVNTYYFRDYPDYHSEYSVRYFLAEIKVRFEPPKL